MTAMDDLIAFDRDTQALGQIMGRLGWDQETMMPRGAATQRGAEMAALQKVIHARSCAPQVGAWIDAAKPETEAQLAMLREIKRSYERALKVPEDLAASLAKVTSTAQGAWAAARADSDFAAFAPVLEEVLNLKRQEGAALADGGDIYDAMLQDYEPGITAADLDQMFGAMRPDLVALRGAILDKPAPKALDHTFDEDGQLALSTKLAQCFGYDLERGRIDKAVHPFSSGSGADVRITTRTALRDPFNCFYSTIHEVGHACYEQNIDDAYALTSLGRGVSMGVHESQSRIYENQLARSRAFCGWLYGQMRDQFGDFGIADEDAFFATVNRVSNGFIRTEADEVQYNLHVLLRFDLERALISGDLQVQDLEAAWNDRFVADFGFDVTDAANGCLQDVHWSVGLFGYFPTYSLGNVYAGCLHQALRQAVPDLDDHLAKGQTAVATDWLKGNVQRFGALKSPRQTVKDACGFEPTHAPLMGYLKDKFGQIYGLG
ncbi:MAG: carboxypeptidase M32 [Planktomarina sp.]